MKIQRLSTASYKFFSPQGKTVVVDPWLTKDPFWPLSEREPERLKEIDVIAITHAHIDHAAGVDEMARQNEDVFVIVQSEFGHYLEARGMKNVMRTNFGGTVELKGIKFSMVPASHTSSWMDQMGKREIFGTAAGYVIEFENGERVYVSGDTGLTGDMKFVVSDFFKPQISILPVTGLFAMEPDQAAYAANVIGSKYVVPSHDFPKEVSQAADPEAYRKLLKRLPVLNSYKKVETFLEIMKRDYPHIETVYIPIGETVVIG